MSEAKYISLFQAAKILGVDHKTMHRWYELGLVTGIVERRDIVMIPNYEVERLQVEGLPYQRRGKVKESNETEERMEEPADSSV